MIIPISIPSILLLLNVILNLIYKGKNIFFSYFSFLMFSILLIAEAIKCYQCSTEKDGKNSDSCGAYKAFNHSEHIAIDCMGEESMTPGNCFCWPTGVHSDLTLKFFSFHFKILRYFLFQINTTRTTRIYLGWPMAKCNSTMCTSEQTGYVYSNVLKNIISSLLTGVSWSCDWGYNENGVYFEECYCAEDNCNGATVTYSPLKQYALMSTLFILFCIFI